MIVVTGAGGMLGKAVVKECLRRGLPVVALDHNSWDVTDPAAFRWASAGDVVINCAGILPGGNDVDMIRVNALAPHYLASLAEQRGFHLIHVSTDCVFSGGGRFPVPRTVLDTPNPDTLYSRSKRAGEPIGKPNVTVIRTSFVGPDHGLWKWVVEQPRNAVIPGWMEAWWSGSTVWAIASNLVAVAVSPASSFKPLEHMATQIPISKYSVLVQLTELLRPDVEVKPVEGVMIDRSLDTTLAITSLRYRLREWHDAVS